jgi:hypothetical protein
MHIAQYRVPYTTTVGAQSIALAKSIAHSHIGYHICEKNEIFEKLCLQKIKKGSIQQQILEPKNTFLAIKVQNNHVPKK